MTGAAQLSMSDAIAPLAADEVPRDRVRLIVVGAPPRLTRYSELPALLKAGDLVVVNDAATLPGSLFGQSAAGAPFELRLSGPIEERTLVGVLLGAGDHRTRTEHRPPPPELQVGERARVGALSARVAAVEGRRVRMLVDLDEDGLWRALYASGAPIQYAHRTARLPLWSVQTAYAARPWAAEMPSAGRPLTWEVILGLKRAGIELGALTHAAGLSSTGEEMLDRALPWPERYQIPSRTALAIARTKERRGRVIAIGTTVVRALEASGGRAGAGVATLRLDARYRPRVVDGLVSGLHAPGESHFDLLAAFAPAPELERAYRLARAANLSGHELGDACLILPRR